MKSLVKATIFLSLMLIHLPCFAQKEKKAMIIGIDGCRPDALQIANTPQMDSLLVNSLYSYDALNDDITISGPGWSSILCGVWSNKHEVTNNAFLTSNYEEYPSIFELVENEDPSIETVSIAHWGPINSFIVQDAADFKMTVSSDLDVAQGMRELFIGK